MKASTGSILSLCSILVFALSWTTSAKTGEDFLQCLSIKTNSSNPPISEAIVTPDDPSFKKALLSSARNLRFTTSNTPRPEYIVVALHESHVQATVVCAKEYALEIRIRSGGHDYEGLSYVSNVPFVLLDMYKLDSINIDLENETAWVQAGATTGQLYYRIAEKSNVHAFPSGVCLSLGTGGHFSGGGYGPLMRKYGLSVDNIIDAELVDASGEILNRSSMGENVFWAIKGGGGASFGVILSWKIKLVHVPETVTVFNVKRSLEQNATDIVYSWENVATKLPKELFIRAISEVEEDTVVLSFVGNFLGNPQELLSITDKSFPELGLKESDCISTSWVNSTLFWAGYPADIPLEQALLNRPVGAWSYFKMKSDYVKEPFSKSTLESIWKKMIETKAISMQWNPYGGRMSEIKENETPFPHRAGNLFLIQYLNSWNEEKDTEKGLNVSRTFYEFMTPFVSSHPRESFLNYRDIDIGTYPTNLTNFELARTFGSKYFKRNFFTLARAKNAIDPVNFFKNEQSIPLINYY